MVVSAFGNFDMKKLILIFSITILSACAGLGESDINENYSMVSLSSDQVDERIDAWFSCDECVSGQLRRIQELGNTARPQLQSALTTVPNLANKRIMFEQQCTRVHAALTARSLVPPETHSQCVNRSVTALKTRHRLRAVEGLLAIRTEETCRVIGRDMCTQTEPFAPLDYRWSTNRSIRLPD